MHHSGPRSTHPQGGPPSGGYPPTPAPSPPTCQLLTGSSQPSTPSHCVKRYSYGGQRAPRPQWGSAGPHGTLAINSSQAGSRNGQPTGSLCTWYSENMSKPLHAKSTAQFTFQSWNRAVMSIQLSQGVIRIRNLHFPWAREHSTLVSETLQGPFICFSRKHNCLLGTPPTAYRKPRGRRRSVNFWRDL